MKRKRMVKIMAWIIGIMVVIFLATLLFIDPYIENKVRSALDSKNSKYEINFDKIHLSLFTAGLTVKSISLRTKLEFRNEGDLSAEIKTLKFKRINFYDALFNDTIEIGEVALSYGLVRGTLPFSKDSTPPPISSMNIKIGKLRIEHVNVVVENPASAQAYRLNEGMLNVYDITISKKDTLSPGLLKKLDFKAEAFNSVTADSMYSNSVLGISYSSDSKTLTADSILIHPNYKDYDFASRQKFQIDRIAGLFTKISVHDFSALEYASTGSIASSFVEVGTMDLDVFRDRRKAASHKIKALFQDLIYNYPNHLKIDSIGLTKGNVIYTEHAEKANHPGKISFEKITAKIYNITNDTIFKTKKENLELQCSALVMGKGKIRLVLRSPLYEPNYSFTLDGSLSAMEAKELNPMLERNAFLYAASGKIDEMNFSFTANRNKADGKMTMLYHDFDIAVKNKETDDTTALKEVIVSWIANMKILNANPSKGKDVRVGIIDYPRNPEAFIFNYCFKSILTGIQSSITKKAKR